MCCCFCITASILLTRWHVSVFSFFLFSFFLPPFPPANHFTRCLRLQRSSCSLQGRRPQWLERTHSFLTTWCFKRQPKNRRPRAQHFMVETQRPIYPLINNSLHDFSHASCPPHLTIPSPSFLPFWVCFGLVRNARNILGTASPSEIIKLTAETTSGTNAFPGTLPYTTKADTTGAWSIVLAPDTTTNKELAGEWTLTLSGESGPSITAANVVFGDNYLCTGQSNSKSSSGRKEEEGDENEEEREELLLRSFVCACARVQN